jgi:hypothetical protein
MGMRSQVYDWDLYGGTTTTGAPATITLTGGGTGYSTASGVATTTVTGSGSGLAVIINAVSGGAITSVSVQTTGEGASASGYTVGDKVLVSGGGGNAGLNILSITPLNGGQHISLGSPFSVFTGGKGNGLGRLPNTTATQFIVVDSYGCTPSNFYPGQANAGWVDGATQINGQNLRNSIAGPRAYLQFYINTTGYFKDSDGVPRDGQPGTAIPYPRTIMNSYCKDTKQTPIYILPGQAWDVRLTCYNDAFSSTTIGNQTNTIATANGQLQAFIKYTLYDGPDALVAIKLLNMGIAITPDSADNYKKKLLEAKRLSAIKE